MGTRDVVVVGASAGGVEALRKLFTGLPADFPAAVLVVLHVPAGSRSALPDILRRAGKLPVKQAEDGDPVRAGQVLVAGPAQHLLLSEGQVSLSRGPTENGHRPSIDVLFRSAALLGGRRVVGVVLSGALDDGAAGLAAIRSRGGIGVVQDPTDALYPGMPRAAIHSAAPEHVVPISEMATLLQEVVSQDIEIDIEIDSDVDELGDLAEVGEVESVASLMRTETSLARLDSSAYNTLDRPGIPSTFSCPDCDGMLARIADPRILRFRCRVGHAWSADSLLTVQSAEVETAMWTALRCLEERAVLTRDLGDRADRRGHRRTAEMFDAQSVQALDSARLVRELMSMIGDRLADLGRRLDSEPA